MFKNYLNIAVRNLLRHKGFSIINILGLAVGIASSSLILFYVAEELSYDRYQEDYQRCYRIAQDIQNKTSNRVFSRTAFPVGPSLKADYPQVEATARICPMSEGLVQYEDKSFYEGGRYCADPGVFDIFTITFLRGDPGTALERPGTVVLTDLMAAKYFGRSEPVGQTLKINSKEYEVTGVVAAPPTNTHWKFQYVLSLKTLDTDDGRLANWFGTEAYTYVKLKPNTDADAFETQIRHLADGYVGARLAEWGTVYEYYLQPLKDIHLYSALQSEMEPSGSPMVLTVFSGVGLLVLLIACMNFVNLATARSAQRAREVGLRKVVGAQRRQLIGQFLGESILTSLLALIASMALVGLALPVFNDLTGMALGARSLFQPGALSVMGFTALLAGFVGGIYPAFVLSSFKPISTLKSSFRTGSSKSVLRRVLVAAQFAASIVLIICTMFAFQQVTFMKNQPLGLDQEQKLVIPFRGGTDIEETYESVKQEFLKHPGVRSAAASSALFGQRLPSFSTKLVGEDNDMNQDMYHLYIDPDFIPSYRIAMIAGLPFDNEIQSEQGHAFLINRSAMRAFGWHSPEEAIGKVMRTGYGGRNSRIIGVTEDFHYRGLQELVQPLVMEWLPERFWNITLTIDTDHLSEVMAFAEDTWRRLYPENPFECYFLDEAFNGQYRANEQAGLLFSLLAVLGIVIAVMGLFGLSVFAAQQRTKEIGVRKILGATSSGIVVLLTREFLNWVLVANLIAWPIAYYAVDYWLKGFAYRTSIDVGTFALAGLLSIIAALMTVCFQAIRAATGNPAQSLRHE